jgi:hypothetical protein
MRPLVVMMSSDRACAVTGLMGAESHVKLQTRSGSFKNWSQINLTLVGCYRPPYSRAPTSE